MVSGRNKSAVGSKYVTLSVGPWRETELEGNAKETDGSPGSNGVRGCRGEEGANASYIAG